MSCVGSLWIEQYDKQSQTLRQMRDNYPITSSLSTFQTITSNIWNNRQMSWRFVERGVQKRKVCQKTSCFVCQFNINLIMQNQNKEVTTIKCPYDPSHVMPYERFLNHLEKCKFADKKSYRKCKFNPYHVYHFDQIANHEKNCKAKKKYEEEEDDWGVDEPPAEEKINLKKQEKSVVSYSTSFSDSKQSVSFHSSHSNSRASQKYGKESKKKQEIKGNNKNSMFEVGDLEDFNPL